MIITKEELCEKIKRMLIVSDEKEVIKIASELFDELDIKVMGKDTYEINKKDLHKSN